MDLYGWIIWENDVGASLENGKYLEITSNLIDFSSLIYSSYEKELDESATYYNLPCKLCVDVHYDAVVDNDWMVNPFYNSSTLHDDVDVNTCCEEVIGKKTLFKDDYFLSSIDRSLKK